MTNPYPPITVLLTDDHLPFRIGMRVLLDHHDDIRVVGEAEDGASALALHDALRPDVMVLDCQLPDQEGPSVAEALRARGSESRVLALSAYSDEQYVRGMLAAGATGYMLKSEAAETIVAAVRATAEGRAFFSASIAAQLASLARSTGGRSTLPDDVQQPTAREMEVLQQLATGRTNLQIARELGIAERTVRFHVENLFGRLNVDNRVEAVVKAMKLGWLAVE